MKRHLTTKDLSAYMDGEHARPESVRKHLQQCADCARDHVALQKVSAHVQALPECDVTFGFTDRVMRAVEAPQPSRRRMARYWVPIGAGMAAALAVMVSVLTINETPARFDESPALIAIQPAPAVDMNFAGMLGPDGSERVQPGAEAGHDVQVAFASEVATRPVPQEFFRGRDYNEGLRTLNASEKQTLFQLLGSSLLDEQLM